MFLLGKSGKQRREYAELCDTTRPLELRTIEKAVLKNFDAICQLLNRPGARPKRQQPNLLSVLPKLAQLLRDIWHEGGGGDGGGGGTSDLSCLTYWRVALRTLADQSSELLTLLRDQQRELDKPSSQASQQFSQWCQSLFFILQELEVMFPDKQYTGYRIASSAAAAEWWQRHFGRSDVVTWHDFQFALGKRFGVRSLAEANELKRDVNVTFSDHVSAHEFDLFARLFAPWGDQTLDLWRLITKEHPAFVRLQFKEVKNLLRGQRPYSYLFRRSTNTPGVWSIGYLGDTGGVTQILVKPDKTIVEALLECSERGLLLFPAGRDANEAPSLEAFVKEPQEPQQPQEQQQQQQQPQQSRPHSQLTKEPQEKSPQDSAAGAAAVDEVYVVAPELQCSQCSRRSDEVSAMESCSHVLCDACFERYVQPKLYENWIMRNARCGPGLFCPVCREEEPSTTAAAGPEEEVDLIQLDDATEAEATAASASGDANSRRSCWSEHPMADFDPVDESSEATGAEAEAKPKEKEDEEEYAKPNKQPCGADPRPEVPPCWGSKPQQQLQTNPFMPDFGSHDEQQPAAPTGGYLFYGSEEAVQQLLQKVPGLRYIRLPDSALQQQQQQQPESPYGQLWDGKRA